ncbi:MAG: hypothetical protein PHS14_03875 [Elusimicrobia bacterium]|nr:hypothetical protein [Elusimicrobiota bacterium]
MKPLGMRLSPMLAMLLFFAFSPAGLEIAHAASHVISGDNHLHWHGGQAHRHAHGAGHHKLLPDEAATTALRDAAPGFDVSAAPAATPAPAPSAAYRPKTTRTASARLAVMTSGPSLGRSPPV